MEWYYVCWPWLTSKCVTRFCQHRLSFLFLSFGLFMLLCVSTVPTQYIFHRPVAWYNLFVKHQQTKRTKPFVWWNFYCNACHCWHHESHPAQIGPVLQIKSNIHYVKKTAINTIQYVMSAVWIPQYSDTVGWVTGRASGLLNSCH